MSEEQAIAAEVLADELERLTAERDRLRVSLATLSEATEQMCAKMCEAADACDHWADETAFGGWSTHHVKANRDLADALRRRASITRRAISEPDAAGGE
jgi:hypothetical protein